MMKKCIFSLAISFLSFYSLSAQELSAEMKSDIINMSGLMCEMIKIQERAEKVVGDEKKSKSILVEAEAKQKEIMQLISEMSIKYKDIEQNKDLQIQSQKFMIKQLKTCDSEKAKEDAEMIEKSLQMYEENKE